MEERIWERTRDQPLHLLPRATSSDRGWNGFNATIYDVSGGYTQTPVFPMHNICMLVGTPQHTSCRCDGLISNRLQRAGEMDIVPAGFSGAWEDHGPASFLVVNLAPSLVRATAHAMGIDAERVSVQPRLHLRDPQLEHLAWALKAELENASGFDRVYAEGVAVAMASRLLRSSTAERADAKLSRPRLRRVLDYIHDNLGENLALAGLAEIANVSPSHFKALFKGSTGKPVHQYIIQCRVDYAIDLLLRAKIPISEVALRAGFSDQSHMARWMRRLRATTPAAVLRSAR